MTLELYNTASKEQEVVEPLDEDAVRMYVCGQTVYDYMHIGHARTYVSFDILRRYLEFCGYAVETVINITDVNDKINDRAAAEDHSAWDVAEEYSRINLKDFDALGVHADVYPKASDYVPEMIAQVQQLIENEYAYEVDGDVFFDVRAFDDYGKLSHQDLEDIRPEREEDIVGIEKKQHPEDFVLWKKRDDPDDHEPTWDSPWGEGVPGWHIECSAMSTALLGEQFDIHGGGSDLVFPHHEDEIAQAEGATGTRPWVNYWLHSGLVRMDEEKMSKSLGNFVSSRKLLEEYDRNTLRLLIAGTHYRKPLDFSRAKLDEAETTARQLEQTVDTLRAERRNADMVPEKYTEDDRAALAAAFHHRADFVAAMDDDLNTPQALTHLQELASHANAYADEADAKRPVLTRLHDTITALGDVLGLELGTETGGLDEAVIDALVDERDALRENDQYEAADAIRDALQDAGIRLQDTDHGTRWTRD